ncbi:MAG: KUP/HAK/KT family potassium transporter [Bacteroidetes bacterium]|nr:KUP/HAK/KT family potassium transporter [Bacteroidota bacterium]
MDKSHLNKVSSAGLIITLGIIYGDIGTSPLYVLKEIIGDSIITKELVFGGVSCIFWTLTLLTTLKYVIITLNADNKGEGGIFSLYAIVRRTKPWLHIPAIIGGAALLADGLITPPISVASAIEGLQLKYPQYDIPVVPIVIGIIVAIFFIQQFGTSIVGKFFGPLMIIWFSMLLVLGLTQITGNPAIFGALNPYYALNLVVNTPGGFWLLGAVFLCTTGAEALYSDLGHCGKSNIRVSWTFVKIALVCNYLGQSAWLMQFEGKSLSEIGSSVNPFFAIMPEKFLLVGILIATMAAIIASQALITGSYTIVNEAMRLNFWPKVRIKFPTEARGQVYVPSINWILMFGCIGVVLIFKESANMGAAYGLAITLAMLSTTVLVTHYLVLHRMNKGFVWFYLIGYLFLELCFLVANLKKFPHGGWVTLLICMGLIFIMWVWFKAAAIKKRFVSFLKIKDYLPIFIDVSNDESIAKQATNLVYFTAGDNPKLIESKIVYSILNKQPKRADVYWFLHINVSDDPYRKEFVVHTLVPEKIFRVDFNLGFRVEQRINALFRKVIDDMVAKAEFNNMSRYQALMKHNIQGDFKFVISERQLANDYDLPVYEEFIMDSYDALKGLSMSESKAFGLDTSSLTVEKVPLLVNPRKNLVVTRIYPNEEHSSH